jgi:hypothetical protein
VAGVRDVRERVADAVRRGELARQGAVAARRRAEQLAEQAAQLQRRRLGDGVGESQAS